MTSGPYHDDAFAHLQKLGLKEEAIGSGADRLNTDTRAVLIQPFKIGQTKKQGLDEINWS